MSEKFERCFKLEIPIRYKSKNSDLNILSEYLKCEFPKILENSNKFSIESCDLFPSPFSYNGYFAITTIYFNSKKDYHLLKMKNPEFFKHESKF